MAVTWSRNVQRKSNSKSIGHVDDVMERVSEFSVNELNVMERVSECSVNELNDMERVSEFSVNELNVME